MVRYGRIQEFVDIPEGVTVTQKDGSLTVKGKLGEITKDFSHTGVLINVHDDKIELAVLFPRRKEKALIGTVKAHINNMLDGVRYGYKYSLKIVFSHFPIRVSVEKDKVKIDNLYGGRKPKYANIVPGAKVSVDGENVIVEGVDKEIVGQTAANIQELTRQRGKRRKSPKTFMDGIFIFNKSYQFSPQE